MFKTKVSFLLVFSFCVLACSGSSPDPSEERVTNSRNQSNRVAETVASHTIKRKPEIANGNVTEQAPSATGTKRKWSRSGRPIDTTDFDKAIAKATSKLEPRENDPAAKKALGTAYFERGVALVGAQQYAAAMGDLRKALKYDSSNEQASKQLAMISAIYQSINIEAPGVGEEPAPLEFKGQKD